MTLLYKNIHVSLFLEKVEAGVSVCVCVCEREREREREDANTDCYIELFLTHAVIPNEGPYVFASLTRVGTSVYIIS